MDLKVAVASGDGISVDQHFGRASRFLVYRLRDGVWEHFATRVNTPACSGQEHSDGLLEQSAALIADCHGVAVAQLGATAFDLLLSRRILPFVLVGTVEEALDVFRKSKLINRVRNQRETGVLR